MAEVQCTNCRRPIVDQSKKCQHCGTLMPVRAKRVGWIAAFVIAVVALVALVSILKYIRSGSTDPNKGQPVVTQDAKSVQSSNTTPNEQ